MAMRKQRYKITFQGDMVKEPIIHGLGRQFELVTNIRRADVRENMGWVDVEIEGDEQEIENGIDWVRSLGVRVDPVSGDVVEG